MMYNYPFFSFPSYRRYSYPNYNNNYYNSTTRKNYNTNLPPAHTPTNKKIESKSEIKKELHTKKSNSNNFLSNLFNQEGRGKDEQFFEIFGIKLYLDDILLICLIFFLYNEGVKDKYLFISLVLLLLS